MLWKILTNDWLPFCLGVFMVIMATGVVLLYMRKRNKGQEITEEDKLVLVSILLMGIWGPVASILGIIGAAGTASLLAWGGVVLFVMWAVWFYFAWPQVMRSRHSIH